MHREGYGELVLFPLYHPSTFFKDMAKKLADPLLFHLITEEIKHSQKIIHF